MREAAERRQQLELEHEQALAVLNAKQQEIDLLQKAKVRELEEKCRTQSEQFNLLSKELEKFRLQAGKFDILSTEPLTLCESPGSPNKSLSQLLNGLAAPTGKGNEAPTSRSLISEFIRPLQISGDKPELLSVKPTFLTRSRTSSPARAFLSEVSIIWNELSSTTRSKLRFTGKVRLCIARYSYNPYDGPNEHPEAELPLVAGKYLYVYGTMDEDGFYEGELLDGQRGLVPSNFVDFIQDEETPSVQHRDTVAKEPGYLNHSSLGPQRLGVGTGTGTGISSLLSDSKLDCLTTSSLGTLDFSIDEVGEDIVPYPRRINLIKQLAKSVIIGWDPPVMPPGGCSISGYNILVDKEVRMSVPYGGRTKSLIEKLNLATNTYRISVQSITDRGLSDELRCTLLVGKDVVVAPYYLRVDSITQVSAELSWMPSNSNYSHTIFLNGAEYDMVRAGGYKYKFFNLKPMTVYKVKVVAQPHQVPWQLPVDQREKREISVEFCTQPAGPPLPPQEVQVQCGQTPGVLQVRWKPPPLTPSGTSNGASVIGYAVCTKGQKIAEVLYPTADYVTVDLNRIQCLEAREVIVRTLSTQGESQDSSVAPQVQPLPRPQPHTLPHSKPLVSAREPETKEHEVGLRPAQPWERSPSPLPPMRGPSLEPPHFQPRRSPSPQRILPQPQGVPIPNTIAKAMAREAAQRVFAEGNRVEKRNIFSDRGNVLHPLNSDEEEDGYDSPHARRRGASVDEFLRGSELGRQVLHSEEYHTESSRGSDLSDIMEEDEEDLYSEMQLEEGRRRSINSHNTLKIIGNSSSHGSADRLDHSGRRPVHIGHHMRRYYYEESEPEELTRVFVALFDYDPMSMSPNPDAADEELPFKEGQIIKVFGNKDTDGFYRAEIRDRIGLIPCNMVSEIQTEDDEMMDQLLQQGFLPLNTPAELTFCAGDVITVFGEIDEDGFYYGELNGHKGLVPSNFLEEVPDDVEVFLTDSPSRYPQDTPARIKTKRKKSVHFTP
uniref:RIMS binding protein 2 n=1 Tax=Mastacembelus armatus TaxID=205130 RepID=A0A3Q3RR64_9TELE